MTRYLLIAATLAACTPDSARPVEFPDGASGFELTCDSAQRCMSDARDACGGPFTVQQSRGADELVTTTYGSATQVGDITIGRTETRTRKERVTRMLVRCRSR